MKVIKVGTRKSKLAMTQTQQLVDQLKALHPERDFVLVPYTTKGQHPGNWRQGSLCQGNRASPLGW